MRVEVFQPYHLKLLLAQGVQPSQRREVSHVPDEYATVGRALTAFDGERVLLCGGIVPLGHIGILWALLAEDAGHHMIALHRATKRFLGIHPPRRIEASVEKGFNAGCRWIELLGFRFEGEMPGYGRDGETHLRYGLVSWQ